MDWSERRSLPLSIAYWLARHAPRGKGYFPRIVGKYFYGHDKVYIRTRSGAKLAIEAQSLEYITMIMRNGGAVDQPVCEACQRFLRPGHVFYDVGANVGFVAAETAMRLRDEVHVIAFEPQPRLARTAAITGALNGFRNWDIYPVILSNREGEDELFLSASAIHASRIGRSKNAKKLVCPVTTIDKLVDSGVCPPPNLIKIDVEGGERDVIRGAAETIRRERPVLVFEADINLRRYGYTRAELFDEIRACGPYCFHGIDAQGMKRVSDTAADEFDNFVAIPVGHELAHGT